MFAMTSSSDVNSLGDSISRSRNWDVPLELAMVPAGASMSSAHLKYVDEGWFMPT